MRGVALIYALDELVELRELRVEVSAPDERVNAACVMKRVEVPSAHVHRQFLLPRGRRVAIDDGYGRVSLARANAEVLKTPVRLGCNEVLDDPVLQDLNPIGQHESRAVPVGVNADRRCRTVGEQLTEPVIDVATREIPSNAHSDLSKFAKAKNVHLLYVDGLDNVRDEFCLCASPILRADVRQVDAHVVICHRQLACVGRQLRKGGLCSTTWRRGGLRGTTSRHKRERFRAGALFQLLLAGLS